MFKATNFVKRVERKIHVQFLDVTADGYSIFKHKHRWIGTNSRKGQWNSCLYTYVPVLYLVVWLHYLSGFNSVWVDCYPWAILATICTHAPICIPILGTETNHDWKSCIYNLLWFMVRKSWFNKRKVVCFANSTEYKCKSQIVRCCYGLHVVYARQHNGACVIYSWSRSLIFFALCLCYMWLKGHPC